MKRIAGIGASLIVGAMTLTACGASSVAINPELYKLAVVNDIECGDFTVSELEEAAESVASATAPDARSILAMNDNLEDLDVLTDALVDSAKDMAECNDDNEESDPDPSESPETDINDTASVWVGMIYSNFADIDETAPSECKGWEPSVDLTEPHFYYDERNKESDSAFGPDFGTTPCEVSINLVERLYRDAMLLLDKAVELGIPGLVNTPEAIAALNAAPFEERQAIADQVLGFYAEPGRVLSIEARNEPYESRGATSDGAVPSTQPSSDAKESNVLVTRDEETGEIEKQDRLDCGLQGYTPKDPTRDVGVNPAVDPWKQDGGEQHTTSTADGATVSNGLQESAAAVAAAQAAAAAAAAAQAQAQADAAAAAAAAAAATGGGVVDTNQDNTVAPAPPPDW